MVRATDLSCSTICAVTGAMRVAPETVAVTSDSETLLGDLYGTLPARRAAILVHGRSWDANGWRDVAPLFVERDVPALALNLRGYGSSSGKTTEYESLETWPPVTDVRAAKALLRKRGAREIALVGASMGGQAVIGSSFEGDVECVVSISAPVWPLPDELSRRMTGRKLFVCATADRIAALYVQRCFDVVAEPKALLLFGGKEHARGMFAAPYGRFALRAIVDFVAQDL